MCGLDTASGLVVRRAEVTFEAGFCPLNQRHVLTDEGRFNLVELPQTLDELTGRLVYNAEQSVEDHDLLRAFGHPKLESHRLVLRSWVRSDYAEEELEVCVLIHGKVVVAERLELG